jgi:hypothetical protein
MLKFPCTGRIEPVKLLSPIDSLSAVIFPLELIIGVGDTLL